MPRAQPAMRPPGASAEPRSRPRAWRLFRGGAARLDGGRALVELPEARLLLRRKREQRPPRLARRHAGQLAAVLAILQVLAALLHQHEDGQEVAHQLAAGLEVLPQDAGLVERHML